MSPKQKPARVRYASGSIGGAIAAAVTDHIITDIGWNEVTFVVSALLIVAAILFLWIDASHKWLRDTPEHFLTPEPALA